MVRSREVSKPRDWCLEFPIAPKFDRQLGSTAAEVHVKFQSDAIVQTTNLAASRLHKILRSDVLSDIETRPGTSPATFHHSHVNTSDHCFRQQTWLLSDRLPESPSPPTTKYVQSLSWLAMTRDHRCPSWIDALHEWGVAQRWPCYTIGPCWPMPGRS